MFPRLSPFRPAVLRLGIVLVAALAVARCAPPEPLPRGEGPSLVVMLAIDQARSDYIERFRDLFVGGIGWLIENGARFSDAHQNHAVTATAPGHASLSTGLEPYRSGIVGNGWFDSVTGQEIYAAGPADNRSPLHLEATGFGDWLKAADPRSKVFTASAKDRSAIMLGGQDPDAAYWYDREAGDWTSSEYYEDAEREWLPAFHRRKLMDRYFGTLWEPLYSSADWPSDGVQVLDRGAFDRSFPYVMGGYSPVADEAFYRSLYATPFVDAYLVEFARALIENEQLGLDGSIDFLGLSFSALDTVGHQYGPNSPEVLDVLARLDLQLQTLISFLDRQVGLEHVIFALSSDHGVVPLPEYRAFVGEEGHRLDQADVVCIQRVGARLGQRLGPDDWLLSGFYLNDETIARNGRDRAEVERVLAELVMECDAVERAWTATELAARPRPHDEIHQRFLSNYFAGRSADVMVQFKQYYMYNPGMGTTHGSAYDYDSRVPIIFAGGGIVPGLRGDRINTVDVAPTLAALIGVPIPEGLDGRDRSVFLRSRPDW